MCEMSVKLRLARVVMLLNRYFSLDDVSSDGKIYNRFEEESKDVLRVKGGNVNHTHIRCIRVHGKLIRNNLLYTKIRNKEKKGVS